jgi:hypothetical protein
MATVKEQEGMCPIQGFGNAWFLQEVTGSYLRYETADFLQQTFFYTWNL